MGLTIGGAGDVYVQQKGTTRQKDDLKALAGQTIRIFERGMNALVKVAGEQPTVKSSEKVRSANNVKKSKPPKTDKNPPKTDPSVAELSVKHPENAGKSVRQQDGTTLEYDDDGYLTTVFDKNGKILKNISRSPDGSIYDYEEKEYDADGHVAKTVHRNSDGAVTEYFESKYDDNGNEIRTIRRTPDGKVAYYQESEYDENGVPVGSIVRAPNGEPMYD